MATALKLGCLLDQFAKPASIGQHECTSAALDETRSLERLELSRYRFAISACGGGGDITACLGVPVSGRDNRNNSA
jgi:hypothetical protein